MNSKIDIVDRNYQLEIEYPIKVNKPFEWFTTTEGFSKWFKELRVENDKLLFVMGDFKEEMEILSFKEGEEVSYKWDQAIITFRIHQNKVIFSELIPINFKNEFADSIKDMAGWCIHHKRLSYLMNGKEAPAVNEIKDKWENWVKTEVEIHRQRRNL